MGTVSQVTGSRSMVLYVSATVAILALYVCWYIITVENLKSHKRPLIIFFSTTCTLSIWKFLNLSRSCNLCHSGCNARSLIHHAGLEIKPATSQRQAVSLIHCITAGTLKPLSFCSSASLPIQQFPLYFYLNGVQRLNINSYLSSESQIGRQGQRDSQTYKPYTEVEEVFIMPKLWPISQKGKSWIN